MEAEPHDTQETVRRRPDRILEATMLSIDVSMWGDDVQPTVRRNSVSDATTVLCLHGTYATPTAVRVGAFTPAEARQVIARLRAACAEWEELVDAIETEHAEKHAAETPEAADAA